MGRFDSEIATIRGITAVFPAVLAALNSIPARVEAAVEAFKQNNPEADTTELDAVLADARAQANDLASAVVANTSQAGSIQPGTGGESQKPPEDTTAPNKPPLTDADQNQG